VFSVSVLGPVEVTRAGQPVHVPAGKTSELLVRLALDAGVMVRTDRLVDDLWADDAINTRRNTVQSKIAKLRRALGDPTVVVSGDGGYMLAVDPSEVDALVVLQQASTASGLLEQGDQHGAAQLCAAALQLFRGDMLVGVGDWVVPHRARLDEARIKLLETRFAARARLGDAGDVIGELEAAVATYPFQESLWGLLITALYQAGRQADALSAYQRVRDRLADELGLDPGPQLQQLEQQILMHDVSLTAGGRGAPPIDRPTVAGNLPSMSTALVGRDAEVAALRDLTSADRLVEIVGPGGIGKTALAIATARQLSRPGGVWLARLETVTTANEIADTLIAALHVTGGDASLFERLKSAETLIILDNCEHIVDAVADLVPRLLDAAPGLSIVCTSQVPLDVDGETLFELAPLTLQDSVELFTRRAAAQRTGAHVGEVGDAVHDLCRSLDGLPLAIELAAARTKTLSIHEITRRLDDRFNVLSDPTSRRPERRRALKATIRWSYELLFPDDQRGLWALSAFAGGAPLSAVEFVLEALDVPALAAIDVVGRLAGRSLVIVDDESSPTHLRYRLLDSIRAFAVEAMDDAGCTAAALAAHARWYADASRASTAGVRSEAQAQHLAFARVERANIDAALAWCAEHDPQLALTIVNGFGWAWVVLGDSRGAQRINAAIDGAGDDAPPDERASALLLAAWLEASTGDLADARRHIGMATVIAAALNDDDLRARCACFLAYVVSHEGEFAQALQLTDQSDALYEGLDRSWDRAANGLFAARAAISAGDDERAARECDHVRRLLVDVHDPWLRVRFEAMLGELARVQRRFDDAVDHMSRAAETSRRLGFSQTEAYQVASLGRAQCQTGDYTAGRATLELAVDKAEATGDVRMAALARTHLGRVLRALGDTVRAREVLELSTTWHRAAGGGEQAAMGECLLAAMDAADEVAGAAQRLTAILETARQNNEAHVEVFALDALARLATGRGDIDSALTLSRAADLRMQAASHFITEHDRTDATMPRSAAR
jgi:predicted ATPase/DNA-binding SARP family transcriptional activator